MYWFMFTRSIIKYAFNHYPLPLCRHNCSSLRNLVRISSDRTHFNFFPNSKKIGGWRVMGDSYHSLFFVIYHFKISFFDISPEIEPIFGFVVFFSFFYWSPIHMGLFCIWNIFFFEISKNKLKNELLFYLHRHIRLAYIEFWSKNRFNLNHAVLGVPKNMPMHFANFFFYYYFKFKGKFVVDGRKTLPPDVL